MSRFGSRSVAEMIGRAKHLARKLVDRSLAPHLAEHADEIERRVARHVEGGAALDPVLTDFNVRLHELRSIELRRLPIDGGVLLSAGCAGGWYFDWLEACAGPFERHIGVELYAPEPPELPANVTWIAETASAMPGVADDSVDVVFSGQNIEHLWIDDMVGFLTEASRVCRSGGWLVIDSPNRVSVEAMGWTHPEHTIELAASEATYLLALAGFAPRVVRGLWTCRDPRTGDWLPLFGELGDVREVLERTAGVRDVDDAHLWWIEAQKTGEPAPVADLRSAVDELFAQHWNRRVNRAATSRSATSGLVYRTQPFPLFTGETTIRASDERLGVRVVDADGVELASGAGSAAIALDSARFGVCVELHAADPIERPPAGWHVAVDVGAPANPPTG